MIYIHKDVTELFQFWDNSSGLLIVPSHNASEFLAYNLDKFGIVELDEYSRRVFQEKRKNYSLDLFLDLDHDLYSRSNLTEAENLFQKTKDNLINEQDIYMDKLSFVLFVEWSKENFKELDTDISFSGGSVDVLKETYSEVKLGVQDMKNLNALLKLLCFFYHKELKNDELKFISIFQTKIMKKSLNIQDFIDVEKILNLSLTEVKQRTLIDKVLENISISKNILEGFSFDGTKIIPSEELRKKHEALFLELLA